MVGSLLFILVGPSGAGKTTLMKRAMADLPDLRRHVTSTTRPARPGEVHGQDYYFIDRATFDRLRAAGQFVEWQEFYGNLYGSTYDSIEASIGGDVDRITSLEVLGAETLQRLYPDNVVTVFVFPPSLDAVRDRRLGRDGHSSDQEQLRKARAEMEMSHAGSFKYAVVNDDLEEATRCVEGIIRAERCARRMRTIRESSLPQSS